ncbi:hypothetical protein ACFOOP_04765 [Marinicaulis aureus]|uniref:Lipoprotein n=1 Tax=Hyphococcus aureus TaxID=2666033 RepID=A0ABW1KV44_9PROT
MKFTRFFLPSSLMLLAAACATAPNVAQQPAKTPVTPAAPVYVLEDFLGAGATALDGLLGEPALTRREGNGEYRRYALTTCTLIIILYPDELGVQKVTQVDATATTSNADKPDLNDCLAAG